MALPMAKPQLAMAIHRCSGIPSHASSVPPKSKSMLTIHIAAHIPDQIETKVRIIQWIWFDFDKVATIPEDAYKDTSEFTLDLSGPHVEHLPYCRSGLPFTTPFSDLCPTLSALLIQAADVGKRRRQNLFDGCSASTPASAPSSEVARRKTVHQAWEKTLWTAVKKETQSQAGTETPMNLRSSTFIRLSARFTNPAPSQIHHPALSQMCPMMMLGLPTGAFHESTLTCFT